MQKRYIQNLLLATTTKVQAEPDETSSEESEFEYNPQERSIGSLTIAEKTIAGLAANDEDMGSLNKFSCKLILKKHVHFIAQYFFICALCRSERRYAVSCRQQY
jgi:hypothetical protein